MVEKNDLKKEWMMRNHRIALALFLSAFLLFLCSCKYFRNTEKLLLTGYFLGEPMELLEEYTEVEDGRRTALFAHYYPSIEPEVEDGVIVAYTLSFDPLDNSNEYSGFTIWLGTRIQDTYRDRDTKLLYTEKLLALAQNQEVWYVRTTELSIDVDEDQENLTLIVRVALPGYEKVQYPQVFFP